MDMQKIRTLRDYKALRQVRSALWMSGEINGAAVMVGAGFSRFANLASETTPLAPTWRDLMNAMLDELYPTKPKPSDPLVVAEEYRSALGPTALENLIRRHVKDGEWTPGDMHHRLLSLPWSDVLTTNWDTLLERCAESNPDFEYKVVHTPSDIAGTQSRIDYRRSARIVKLHGSIPSRDSLIFTQEDFRTYPIKFAPFVNLARQVLLENELCLIGFSGDDPNFLEWSGWVRDQLGDAARPIRLIGNLNLSDSHRRLLERRNVTPIDLGPIVKRFPKEAKHHQAVKILLNYFTKGKPSKSKWARSFTINTLNSLDKSTLNLTDLVKAWKKDRKKHPGWLVTPSPLRADIRESSNSCMSIVQRELDAASDSLTATFLYEAVWRWETALSPLPEEISSAVQKLASTGNDRSLSAKQRAFIRTAIVRDSRYRQDWTEFSIRLKLLNKVRDPDARSEVWYQRCLAARDKLDYDYVAKHFEKITGDDPVWILRKAALAAEVINGGTAVTLIRQAYQEIRNRRCQNRHCVWLLSREAWAFWLLEQARFDPELTTLHDQRDWPLNYQINETDPREEIRQIDLCISRVEQGRQHRSRSRRPRFDAGTYSVSSLYFNNMFSRPINDSTRIMERVGIPFRLNNVDVFASQFARALNAFGQYQSIDTRTLALAATVCGINSVDTHFSRVCIAKLSSGDVSEIIRSAQDAIEFGRNWLNRSKGGSAVFEHFLWTDRLCNMVEVLSRFGMRLRGTDAIELINLGTSLSHKVLANDGRVLERIESLIGRGVDALEPERHSEIAFDILRLPIHSEIGSSFASSTNWVRVFAAVDRNAWKVRSNVDDIVTKSAWTGRIAVLIQAASDGSSPKSRQDALHRLMILFAAGVLFDNEIQKFTSAIWNGRDRDNFPSDTGLSPHVILMLPIRNSSAHQRIFNAYVVSPLANGLFKPDLLQGLHRASYSLDGKYNRYPIAPKEALRILDHALKWRRTSEFGPVGLNPFNQVEDQIAQWIGPVLASAVVPALSKSKIGPNRVNSLLHRPLDGSLPPLYECLPVLSTLDKSLTSEVTEVIQKGLMSRLSDVVSSAINAVFFFVEISADSDIRVPKALVDEMVSICVMRREIGLISSLQCVRQLVQSGSVADCDRRRLASAVEALLVETDYSDWRDESRTCDVGLIREEAVRLAITLVESGICDSKLRKLIKDSRFDAMPEVRRAAFVE